LVVQVVKGRILFIAAVVTAFFGLAPAWGFVSVHEKGTWPADWPEQLESFRDRARTFDVGTTVRESVYEIRFETKEEFEQVWPTLLQLRTEGSPLRVSSVDSPDELRTGMFPNDAPAVRIYTPVYGSSAQRPGGAMLPVGPPWPRAIMLPNDSLPEYVAISDDGARWVPVVGKSPDGFRHRARVDIEIVADGKVLDAKQILVPAGIPLIDNRATEVMPRGDAWYVSPDGRSGSPGTVDAPWDLASALAGKQDVRPGDTIYLTEGVYRRRPNELFEVRLQGTAENPVQVRPVAGQRAVIDGGLSILSPSANVWIRDLEILVSEAAPSKQGSADFSSAALKRLTGGLHMRGGIDCKYVNLVIHHCSQGISCWKGETNPEIYGCILYGNGWTSTDRNRGHCIYTQNDRGVITISNCIVTCPYEGSYAVRVCGAEQTSMSNLLLAENICYDKGPLVVGGVRPNQGIRIRRNVLYGIDMQIGRNAPYNEDCEIVGNVVVNGELETTRFRKLTRDDNFILPPSREDRPVRNKYVLLPNRYDRKRAHLAVFNWDDASEVEIETGRLIDEGDMAELFDPENLFGNPIAKVVCRDEKTHVPVRSEFSVFVLRITRR
jgi:hypothetical protein